VRFVMASHSQLKYGARLINSYLGNNATISCCEVLNSLIFPAHEQHHNNSFLIAALVMGQSNMAAGATIGSNHNSRAADGELVAGRGFWPGLCVSVKHNSRFASFSLLAKGDYPAELNIPIPFCLVSNDASQDKLLVMPAYWFLYNMYALARNAAKYVDRDTRTEKVQHIEYDFLAPDSVNEIFEARNLLAQFTAMAFDATLRTADTATQISKGDALLNSDLDLSDLPIFANGFENSDRPVQLLKVKEGYVIFKKLVVYYGITQLLAHIQNHEIRSFQDLMQTLPQQPQRTEWLNMGGQLVPQEDVQQLIESIRNNTVKSWKEIHDVYRAFSNQYHEKKRQHAVAALLEISNVDSRAFTPAFFKHCLEEALATKAWMFENIYTSRAKDYQNPFRQMLYNNDTELEAVIGKLDDNSFIQSQEQELNAFQQQIKQVIQNFRL
jgi:hypothetical protein